jgi:hypothetical protein
MKKTNWQKTKIERSGTYAIKNHKSKIELADITYNSELREWSISDYPHSNVTDHFPNDGTIEWIDLDT